MSRFEDTLQRDLTVIADRATPSPHAWAQIQRRIVDQEPPHETEIIMLTDNTTRPRRWPVLAAAAAVLALVVGGVALLNRGDDTNTPADDPTPATTPLPEPDDTVDTENTADPDPEADPDTADEAGPETAEPEPAEPADATELSDRTSGLTLPAGEYRSDLLGVPIRFSVPDLVRVGALERGVISLTSYGPNDLFRGLYMSRVGSWFSPDEAVDPTFTGLGSLAPDQIDQWLALQGISVDEPSTVTIGGREALYRSFTVAPTHPYSIADVSSCHYPEWTPCFWADSASADTDDPTTRDYQIMALGEFSQIWLVDMGGYEPLLIRAYGTNGMDDERTQTWLDEIVPQIVDSIELGEPTYAVPGGSASLTTDVEATGTWSDEGYSETPQDDGSFDVTYVTTMEGDIRGTSTPITAFRLPDESGGSVGGGLMEFTGEIDGLGTGTLTFREEFISLPVFLSVSVVVDGTGDFAGATGWALFDPDSVAGTYEFHVSVPDITPRSVDTTSYSLTANYTDGGSEQTDIGPDTRRFTGSVTYTGDLDGPATYRGVSSTAASGEIHGYDEAVVFTGTIDGVGTGSFVTAGPFRQDPNGQYLALELIGGGTGDFAGAGGTVRYTSSDFGGTGIATFELELPTG